MGMKSSASHCILLQQHMLEEKTLPLETHTQHPEAKPDLVIAVGENSILFL